MGGTGPLPHGRGSDKMGVYSIEIATGSGKEPKEPKYSGVGALGGTRTPDTLVRSLVLYPAELRAQEVCVYFEFLVGRIRFELMTQRLKASCATN